MADAVKGKKGKGGRKKLGRDVKKCGLYKTRQFREKNKTVRVAKSNGLKAALEYAGKHGLISWAEKRLRYLSEGRHLVQTVRKMRIEASRGISG